MARTEAALHARRAGKIRGASYVRIAGRGHGCGFEVVIVRVNARPHPGPLPRGEGESFAAARNGVSRSRAGGHRVIGRRT